MIKTLTLIFFVDWYGMWDEPMKTPPKPPAVVKPSPIKPTPAPAAPEVPRVTATAPAVYWMFSNRNQTWYTHHDKAYLETYVRGLDAVRYAAPANCANGTCPRR